MRYDDAENLWGVGQALDALGSRADARVRWRQALDILAEIDAVTPDDLALLRRQDPPDTPSIIARTPDLLGADRSTSYGR
ncbi:hypothetical protein Vau01_113550 [Virgisporangium aurantiacum]|uniref:Tetratricopeptide repeat-containing protein n=1 Tax=Virgisporangium aurantiacum TaxID=175570 RepID=A0A8J3ZH82_9ACTN|nr:hypothetical protein Vau01_113550 [Virgisporangium aurantiacum]